ncbi:hypothetical protein ACJRO7_010965 [Eucalyptus globulus]|uniref:Uncharacterized protein n=1 Tax=Eucalyptus globulus TaxID=34317 RepID=A0ABD3LDP7_EUCGL
MPAGGRSNIDGCFGFAGIFKKRRGVKSWSSVVLGCVATCGQPNGLHGLIRWQFFAGEEFVRVDLAKEEIVAVPKTMERTMLASLGGQQGGENLLLLTMESQAVDAWRGRMASLNVVAMWT